jgi:hypothetical protein
MRTGPYAARSEARAAISEGTDVALACFFVAAAAAYLCVGTPLPPLAEYPQSLARFAILAHGREDPYLSPYYAFVWQLQPNLATDALAYLLSPIADIYTVGRLTVWATYISLLAGCVLLYRALHGHFSVVSLLAALLLLNGYFTAGHLGFLLTLGGGMIALAAWIAGRDRPIARLAVGAAAALALYLGQLYGFAIYALCLLGYELQLGLSHGGQSKIARWSLALLSLLPPVLVALLARPPVLGPQGTPWTMLGEAPPGQPLIAGYDPLLEYAMLAAALLGIAGAWTAGRARLRVDLGLAVAALVAVGVALPLAVAGTHRAERCLMLPVALLLLLSVDWRAPTSRGHALQWALVGGLIAAQLAHVSAQWRSAAPLAGELVRLTSLVEKGATVASLTIAGESAPFPPLRNAVALFVVETAALVPSLEAYPADAAAPLRYRPDHADQAFAARLVRVLPGTAGALPGAIDRELGFVARHGYRYLLLIDEVGAAPALPARLRPIGATSDGRARLFEIAS